MAPAGVACAVQIVTLRELRQTMPDHSESARDLVIPLGRDGEYLGLVSGLLRHHDERGGPLALDVELDAPQAIEGNVEGDPISERDRQASVGDEEPGVDPGRLDINPLVSGQEP